MINKVAATAIIVNITAFVLALILCIVLKDHIFTSDIIMQVYKTGGNIVKCGFVGAIVSYIIRELTTEDKE